MGIPGEAGKGSKPGDSSHDEDKLSAAQPHLSKSNSTKSIRALGSLPYGSLKIVQPSEVPSIPEASSSSPATPSDTEEPPQTSPRGPLSPCLKNGCCFIILGLSSMFVVGCDTMALTVAGDSFLGFRDITPGPHLVWVSQRDSTSRFGYWFVSKAPGSVRVKQWNSYNETLGEVASEAEARNQTEDIESIYPKLVPYAYDFSSPKSRLLPPSDIWRRLTSCITSGLLRRVTHQQTAGEWLVETTDTAKGENIIFGPTGAKPFGSSTLGSDLSFIFPRCDAGIQRLAARRHNCLSDQQPSSEDMPDTSQQIITLLDSPSADLKENDLVGELQFTYLSGVLLSNLSCIDQWWHLILNIILPAHNLVASRPGLCRSLLLAFHAQLVFDEHYIVGTDTSDGERGMSILDTRTGNKGRLRRALAAYKRRINDTLLCLGDSVTQEQSAVGDAFAEVEAWFGGKYGWDFRIESIEEEENASLRESEDDDYEPVVVDLDSEGNEIGMIRLG